MTEIAKDMLYEFEKDRARLLYVPRYNPTTDSFDPAFQLPDVKDLKDHSKATKSKSSGH